MATLSYIKTEETENTPNIVITMVFSDHSFEQVTVKQGDRPENVALMLKVLADNILHNEEFKIQRKNFEIAYTENQLNEITKIKNGNKEMAIFFDPDYTPSWRIDLGNTCVHTMLGESEADMSIEGDSLYEVIDAMKVKIGI